MKFSFSYIPSVKLTNLYIYFILKVYEYNLNTHSLCQNSSKTTCSDLVQKKVYEYYHQLQNYVYVQKGPEKPLSPFMIQQNDYETTNLEKISTISSHNSRNNR
jgi:hypothetical protein